MNARRAASAVGRWVRLYTHGLPGPIAERRIEEVGADLHDHVTHERGLGTSDRRIALALLSRMARGMTDDLSWRRRVGPVKGDRMIAFAIVLVAALGLAAIAFVLDSPLLLMLAVLMVVVDVIGLFAANVRTARQGGFVLPYFVILGAALGVAAIAVTAIVVGERGDAPGLVLLGVVLIVSVVVGSFAIGLRTAQRSG